jgi:hypothetical protein
MGAVAPLAVQTVTKQPYAQAKGHENREVKECQHDAADEIAEYLAKPFPGLPESLKTTFHYYYPCGCLPQVAGFQGVKAAD